MVCEKLQIDVYGVMKPISEIGYFVTEIPTTFNITCSNRNCKCVKDWHILPSDFYRDCDSWLQSAMPTIHVSNGISCVTNKFESRIIGELQCENASKVDLRTCTAVFTARLSDGIIYFIMWIGVCMLPLLLYIMVCVCNIKARKHTDNPVIIWMKNYYSTIRLILNSFYFIVGIYLYRLFTSKSECKAQSNDSSELWENLFLLIWEAAFIIEFSMLSLKKYYKKIRVDLPI